jgi:molecular chaperone DnaJ
LARRDLYATLGVTRGSSADEIKKAYRSLARRYHPDRNDGDEEAADRFRDIAEAYETLSNPELRSRYDRLGPLYRPDGRPPSPDEVSDWVSDTIGSVFRKRRPEQGEDLRYTLSIDLEAVATGGERTIEVRRQKVCTTCRGSGADPKGGEKTCDHCSGSGKVGARRLLRSKCPHCTGTGKIVIRKCPPCAGAGRAELIETLKVRIPKGVATGQKLKLREKGNDPRTPGETGDLYVIISVNEHALFKRRGTDLYCEIPITYTQAILGSDLTVPTIDGKTTIRVPPGTESGKVLRLVGRGLPTMKGGRKGDMHLELRIEVPQTVSPKQRKAIESLDKLLGNESHPLRSAFIENMRKRT